MTIQEAKAQVSASTIYKTWDNIKQELKGTSEYEDLLNQVLLLLEKELSDAKWLVKAYSKSMNINLEGYQKATEKNRILLNALEDLYFFTPNFPDNGTPFDGPFMQGLEKATRNAKKTIEDAKKSM